MILRDRVEVLRAGEVTDPYSGETMPTWSSGVTVEATLRAEVTFTTVSVVTEPGRNALVEQLRAVVEPFDYDPAIHRLRWRGEDYTNDGPPMVRRRHGADHHLTIPLQRVDG